MKTLMSKHINSKFISFATTWSPFHVCLLLLSLKTNHSCDTLEILQDIFKKSTDKMFPQIQIKYLKPKPLNGYTKPLGTLSMRQDVHMLFTQQQRDKEVVIFIWHEDCSQRPLKQSLGDRFPCLIRLTAPSLSTQHHHSRSNAFWQLINSAIN